MMGRASNIFDDSAAGQAGSMYAERHYRLMLVKVLMSRYGGWLAIALLLFIAYRMGSA